MEQLGSLIANERLRGSHWICPVKGIWRVEAIIPVIECGRKIIRFGKETHAFQLAVHIDQTH